MQRHLLNWLAIVTLVGFGFATPGLAQPPRLISIQGQLTGEFSESLPDDDYQMIFSIYDLDAGGDALWSETQTVALHAGVYDVVLGSVAVMDLPFDQPYFLGIDVDGDGEMNPRLPLTSVGYALRAAEADGVADGAIVSQMLAPGAVETDAVADGAITAAKITDGSGSGLDADLLDGNSADDFLSIGGGSLNGPLSVPSLAIGNYTALTLGGDDNQSTFLGHNTDHASSVGWHNTMLGSSTGSSLTYGEFNTFVGSYAGTRAQDSYANTFVGASAGLNTVSGDYNLYVGDSAGLLNVTGSNNTFIGSMAGANLHSGSGNLFLGHHAGRYQVGSNMLVISNSSTFSPLIYGEFDNQLLEVNGTLSIDRSTGPHLIIHDTDAGPTRPGIQFTNNNIHYIAGDDLSDESFGFYAGYGNARTHDARLRVYGKAADDWGTSIGLTHDGTDGILDTDTGDLVLDPGGDVSVAGGSDLKIEGAANGIEFGDGTRQTTAASPDFNYQRVENSITYNDLPTGSTASLSISCPSGYLVTGGGASNNGIQGMQIVQSRPTSDDTWFAEFWNDTGGPIPAANVTVYAVCMQYQ